MEHPAGGSHFQKMWGANDFFMGRGQNIRKDLELKLRVVRGQVVLICRGCKRRSVLRMTGWFVAKIPHK